MLFFHSWSPQNLHLHYISQLLYELPKNTIRNICSRIMFFPQTLKDITLIYDVISGLQKPFSDWRIFCREGWEKRYNYIQFGKNKDLNEKVNIRNVSKLGIKAVPETTAF